MKNLSFYFILFLLFSFSCDNVYFDERYITNHCDDSIHVKFVHVNTPSREYNIAPHTSYMYSSGDQIGTHPKYYIRKSIYENIIVTKKGVVSKIDYVNPDKWIFEEVEKKNRYKVYLVIKPEDFENE